MKKQADPNNKLITPSVDHSAADGTHALMSSVSLASLSLTEERDLFRTACVAAVCLIGLGVAVFELRAIISRRLACAQSAVTTPRPPRGQAKEPESGHHEVDNAACHMA